MKKTKQESSLEATAISDHKEQLAVVRTALLSQHQ